MTAFILSKVKGKGYPHQTEPLFAPHLPHMVLEFVPPHQPSVYAYTSGFFFGPNCSALDLSPLAASQPLLQDPENI